MIVDEIITLEDGNEYVLLYKTQVDGGEYFVASKLIDANPSTEYQVFELAKEKLDTFVYEVDDEQVIERIVNNLENDYDKI